MKTKYKETELGLIPENWEKYLFKDFIKIINGFAFKSEDFENEGTPIIKIKNITPPIISFEDLSFYNKPIEKYIEKYIIKEGDIIISMTGSNVNQMSSAVGKVAKYKSSFISLLNQRACKLEVDKSFVNLEYIYQYIKRPNIQYYLATNAAGSANQANISPAIIESIPIYLPPLPEQSAIAKILSDLDSKIELLQKQNETLEKIGKALFKHWFVDFEFPNEKGLPYKSSGGEMVESELGEIPKGWKIKLINELTSKFATGLNPRKNFVLGKGNNYYVTIKNITDNKQIILNNNCDKIDDDAIKKINNRSDLKKNDILFSGVATIGRVFFIDEKPINWNVNESIFSLRANDTEISPFLLYNLLISKDFQNYAQQLASGSVQRGIRMADLKRYKFVLPKNKSLNKLSESFEIILLKQKKNIMEIKSLQKTRDLLLPKLMTGKIRVPMEETKND